jgi:hypothetical protein
MWNFGAYRALTSDDRWPLDMTGKRITKRIVDILQVTGRDYFVWTESSLVLAFASARQGRSPMLSNIERGEVARRHHAA